MSDSDDSVDRFLRDEPRVRACKAGSEIGATAGMLAGASLGTPGMVAGIAIGHTVGTMVADAIDKACRPNRSSDSD